PHLVAGGRAHAVMERAAGAEIEIALDPGEALRPPPFRQVVRLAVDRPHQRERRVVGPADRKDGIAHARLLKSSSRRSKDWRPPSAAPLFAMTSRAAISGWRCVQTSRVRPPSSWNTKLSSIGGKSPKQ